MRTKAPSDQTKQNQSCNDRQTSHISQSQFEDNRSELADQLQLQTYMANNSQVKKLQATQTIMKSSPQVGQLQSMQAVMTANTQAKYSPQENSSATNSPVEKADEDEPLQRKEDNALIQCEQTETPSPKPNNTGLPDNLKTGIENLSGIRMDHVRVHYNSDKPAQLQAHAYAQGSEIHVAPDQEQHLPHEAWHLVQQAQGWVKPNLQMMGEVTVNDDAGLEHEADVMGTKAVSVGVAQGKSIESGSVDAPQGVAHSSPRPVPYARQGGTGNGQAVMQGKFLTEDSEPIPVEDHSLYTHLVELIQQQASVMPENLLPSMLDQASKEDDGVSIIAWLQDQKIVPKSEQEIDFSTLLNQAIEQIISASLQKGMKDILSLVWGLHDNGKGPIVGDLPGGPAIWYSSKAPMQNQSTQPSRGKEEGEWLSRQQLTELTQKKSQLFTEDLQQAIQFLPTGTKISGEFELWKILTSIVAQEKDKKQPGSETLGNAPLQHSIKVGEHWYNKTQLEAHLGSGIDKDTLKLLDSLKSYSRFESFSELNQALQLMEVVRLKEKQQKEEQLQKQEQERLEKLKRLEHPNITSMEGMLDRSEEIENIIGKHAAVHSGALGAAQAMSKKVVIFIEAFHEKDNQVNLYKKLAAGNSKTSGFVGNDPEDIKQALLDSEGTLQEKMTHVLAFKHLLSELLLHKDLKISELALELAKEIGFSQLHLNHILKMAEDKNLSELINLKSEVVPSRNIDQVNQKPLTEIGIPFSKRETKQWSNAELPEFEVGSRTSNVDVNHAFVKRSKQRGFPIKSGPSTHTAEIFEMRELLGLEEDVSLKQMRLAALGYLLPIDAHSLIEVQHTAEMFGVDHDDSQLLYHQIMQELGIGQNMVQKTGKAILETLGGELLLKAYQPEHLMQAHHLLQSSGFVFIGYHGAKQEGFEGIYKNGFQEGFEKRKKDDPWRGAYLAPDTRTAMGYLEKGGGLLRIYIPLPVLKACIQARLPLDDILVGNELATRLNMDEFVPSSKDVILVGRERTTGENEQEANSLEAVISWRAAKQCIALPSLHEVDKVSEFEEGLANPMPIPRRLTFENQMSKGGLEFEATNTDAPEKDWNPSGKMAQHDGQWDMKAYASHDSNAKQMPNRRELVLLQKLGFKVKLGMDWQQINMISLPQQANGATLREMLELASGFHEDSPAWSDFVHRFNTAKDHSEIMPGLYLSGWIAAEDLSWQRKHVKAVLNCCQFGFPQDKNIHYDNINVTGYSNNLFEWTSQKIEVSRNKGMLVHCVEGKNRSATVMAAYLMKSMRWDALKAVRYITAHRSWASPDVMDLLGWESWLVSQGYIKQPSKLFNSEQSSKNEKSRLHSPDTGSEKGIGKPQFDDSESEFPGLNWAIYESWQTSISQVQFESVGSSIGLNKYLTLHNASGAYNNCLIYSIAGALGLSFSASQINKIGEDVRQNNVGVEQNGFLNAAAVPTILAKLGASATRVVLIDTSGKVDAPETGGDDTYSAEIVNSGASQTVFIVNKGFIHFGYGITEPDVTMEVFHDETGDGNRWIQFKHPNNRLVLHSQSIKYTMPPQNALKLMGLEHNNLTPLLLRNTFRKLALQWAPDKNLDDVSGATEKFKLLQHAVESLRDYLSEKQKSQKPMLMITQHGEYEVDKQSKSNDYSGGGGSQ